MRFNLYNLVNPIAMFNCVIEHQSYYVCLTPLMAFSKNNKKHSEHIGEVPESAKKSVPSLGSE